MFLSSLYNYKFKFCVGTQNRRVGESAGPQADRSTFNFLTVHRPPPSRRGWVTPNIVEETILLTLPTSGPIACNQLKLAPPGRWHETLHVYSVVVCVDNRS